jgi:fructose-1,6-bisphosphatase II
MRLHLSTLDIDGLVVIGEGEKDSAPMLSHGDPVGTGAGMVVDVAVDPVDGTTLTASGMPGAIAVIALAEGRGTMYAPGSLVYMDKIAVGPEAAGSVELGAPVEHNLRQVAKAKRKEVNDLRVLILDRERNQPYIDGVRQAGARISLIRDGDVAGAIATSQDETAADVLLGIGGSPEAVIAAAALKCIGGEIQCKLWPRNEEERQYGLDEGLDLDQVMDTAMLVASENVFFAATGVTGGEYLQAVEFRRDDHVVTHSVIMRSKTGSIRYMEATHNIARLGEISAQTLD